MSTRTDSPERRDALATSNDLAIIRIAARKSHVGMRRMRWRVGGRICFTFQPYGTPYSEWGSLGRVYLDEHGIVEEASYRGSIPSSAENLALALEMIVPVGTALALSEHTQAISTVTQLNVLDTITLDLAAEPMLEELVRDADTGELEIVITPMHLTVYEAYPDTHDETYEELITPGPPALSATLRSWSWCTLGFTMLMLAVALWVYCFTYFGVALVGVAAALTLGALQILAFAIRMNDQALRKSHVYKH